jgi:hypothetical protein
MQGNFDQNLEDFASGICKGTPQVPRILNFQAASNPWQIVILARCFLTNAE